MKKHELFKYPEVGVPFLWPVTFFLGLEEAELEVLRENIKFLKEIEKTQIERPKPDWATKNKVILELHTMNLRGFSSANKGIYTLVVTPYAGHTSVIADFHKGQSLVETLLENGIKKVCVTEWKSATQAMKDYDIDMYLRELNTCVDDIGGVVNLVGLCQGGWLATMYAARFHKKVNTLVLAGAPIDTNAGKGDIKKYAHAFSMKFYEELVVMGGGVLKGEFMLQGFKNMHPVKQYAEKFVDLYEHIDDPKYVKRFETFERWYEYTIDVPGKWYLQVIKELFKENRLFKGKFVGLGKRLNLSDIKCPVYLLAGDRDDITPKEQVFNAEARLGTTKSRIVKDLAAGGHIGLFMGSKPLRENWPKIAKWIRKYSKR
jgi:polyhydroxyalkanoate depolymerase